MLWFVNCWMTFHRFSLRIHDNSSALFILTRGLLILVPLGWILIERCFRCMRAVGLLF